MSKLLLSCESLFGSPDLYVVLGISNKSAKDGELKKAYYKVSLKVHPDRVTTDEKDNATEKFKTLSKVYNILIDKDKRAIYDETGEVDDESFDSKKDWYACWRGLFKKVTKEDILEFEEKYKGSKDELKDLKQVYSEGKGSMNFILENVLCATVDDEERFTEILNGMIENGELEEFPKFSKRTKKQTDSRKKKAKKEEAEAEEMKKELGLGDVDDSLQQLILNRGKQREQEMNGFLDSLGQKYGSGSKKSKAKAKK